MHRILEKGVDTMYCIECGQRLPDGAKFCFSCGSKTVSEGELPSEKEPVVHDSGASPKPAEEQTPPQSLNL